MPPTLSDLGVCLLDGRVIEVRRAADRFTTRTDWLTSRHSFSFGPHYDPGNVAFAELVAHNEDVVAPGAGYDKHAHVDTEIVTWVLEGSLVHQDSNGVAGVLRPGQVQRMTAGRGVLHSERNDEPGPATPTRFVQMWLRPDEPGLDPSYQQHDVGAATGLLPLVSGIDGLDAAVRIHTSGAALHLARLATGESVELPDAPHLHVFVARGSVDLETAGRLVEGDAARFTGDGGPVVSAMAPAEVLVWQLR
jgi:redox-sensitive bicupin YhaK (pirin superfamily)